jgi:prepilin-type N-terminal cleavage/methylation domain-containing protein
MIRVRCDFLAAAPFRPPANTSPMSQMSESRRRRRRGFTLIETIVTVGLIAVIAAFVIPTVIQKAGAGDPVKVQNDLNTVRTALETFATDVKNGYPRLIHSLTITPTNTDRFLDSTTFTSNQIAVWNGPYMAATLSTNAQDSLATGYTAYIMNLVDKFDAVASVPQHDSTGITSTGWLSTNTQYASVEVHGLTYAQALAVNKLFDGSNDTPSPTDSANTSGRLRWLAHPNPTNVRVYFLATPIT